MPILNWLNRDETLVTARQTPCRMLEEDKQYSYGDPNAQNIIVQGDNLEALKALLPYYAGQVKCIFIDPPYNTRSAFEHYDDNLEHSQWLHVICPRLELLRDFLREDGSIWVTIDDNEAHYLKVIMDEIFGRKNFIVNALWQKRTSPDARLQIGDAHDHILVYSKSADKFILNRIPLSQAQISQFKNPDNDPRGPWTSTDFTAQGWRPNQMYPITTPSGKVYNPPEGRCWSNVEPVFKSLLEDNRLWFGREGDARPRVKNYLAEHEGVRAWSWWTNEEVGHNQEAKKEIIALFGKDTFDTPKPERLIKRVLDLATSQGELVLDSFLGSGTTAAVAHKMGRRYIGIELGDHAMTHAVPRLQKVVDGEQGGISKSVNWQGGGGFRFYRLGETVFDENGQPNPSVHFPALAAHIWFCETGSPYQGNADSPLLGVHNGIAYYLLYNGILGDKRPDGGNVLTQKVLADLPPFDGPKVIYGEASRLGEARLVECKITFKQTPYDLKIR